MWGFLSIGHTIQYIILFSLTYCFVLRLEFALISLNKFLHMLDKPNFSNVTNFITQAFDIDIMHEIRKLFFPLHLYNLFYLIRLILFRNSFTFSFSGINICSFLLYITLDNDNLSLDGVKLFSFLLVLVLAFYLYYLLEIIYSSFARVKERNRLFYVENSLSSVCIIGVLINLKVFLGIYKENFDLPKNTLMFGTLSILLGNTYKFGKLLTTTLLLRYIEKDYFIRKGKSYNQFTKTLIRTRLIK